MRKKILIFLIMFFICPFGIKAIKVNGCDVSVLSRLKSEASNVNIAYDYYVEEDYVYYKIILTNITPNMYLYDTSTGKNYYYNNTNSGELIISVPYSNNGKIEFYSLSNDCSGNKLLTRHYKLPAYNYYYDSALCAGIDNFSACKRWTNNSYTYEEMKNLTDKYRELLNKGIEQEGDFVEYKKNIFNEIIDWYINNYYYLLIGIIVICLIVIFIKKRKSQSFKLN